MSEKHSLAEHRTPGPAFTIYILLLLASGIGAAIYLTWLYYASIYGLLVDGDTFCNINEYVNCVTVANSSYSHIIGVPNSILGFEYFFLLALGIVFAASSRFRFAAWDSILFYAGLVGLPFCIILGLIAAFIIKSVCIVCLFVYLVTFIITLSIAIYHRFRFRPLFADGPLLLLDYLKKHKTFRLLMILIFSAGIVQLFVWPTDDMGDRSSSIKIGTTRMQFEGLTLGPQNAPIKIEEFTDYECPFCSRAHVSMMKVLEKYPDKIRFSHRDYPLDNSCNPLVDRPFHQNACRAARYGRCAAKQNRYWQYEHLLFDKKNGLEDKALLEYAAEAGLDIKAMQECVAAGTSLLEVQQDINKGIEIKIEGTPTYIIDFGGQKETVVGFRQESFWEEKIQSYLNKIINTAQQKARQEKAAD